MHVFVSCVCTQAHTHVNVHKRVTLSCRFCLGSPDPHTGQGGGSQEGLTELLAGVLWQQQPRVALA